MFFENINYIKDVEEDDDSLLDLTEDDDDNVRNQIEQPLIQKQSSEVDKINSFVLNDFTNNENEVRLYGVFVIAFDTRLGNIVEWQISDNDLNFSKIEFKAMPSGIHTMKDDLVY